MLVIALFGLAQLCGCGAGDPEPVCVSDEDCGAGVLCLEGTCLPGCASHDDCAPAAICVEVEGGAGVCEEETETGCVLSSDCPLPLVCRRRRCLNTCELDVDCPFSGICADDGEGGNVCLPSGGCVLDGECPTAHVCYFGACVPECLADRDCPSDSACIEMRCVRRG